MDKLTRAIINVSVNKGLDDILDNPERGTRNLVDLGDQFATGKYQKLFFNIAQQQLSDADSPYYKIVEKAIKHTDRGLLTNFSINLAYNGWTFGAKLIRRLEEQGGFNIPWTILFRLEEHATISTQDIGDIISQGKALGIYNYFFSADDSWQLMPLLQLLAGEKDCAFELLAPPSSVIGMAEEIKAAGNLATLIDLGANQAQLRQAADELSGQGSVYGGYIRYGDLPTAISEGQYYDLAQAYGMHLLMLVDGDIAKRSDIYEHEELVMKRWKSLDRPVFPIDLYMDLALVDRNISSEGCLAIVQGDGCFLLTNTESGQTTSCGSIAESTLEDMLKKALPKARA